MRGEYAKQKGAVSRPLGSPPHARGILDEQEKSLDEAGITPACAGNTVWVKKNRKSERDHPRMRGEYPFVSMLQNQTLGSPPHARGILFLPAPSRSSTGITPACAGNTSS